MQNQVLKVISNRFKGINESIHLHEPTFSGNEIKYLTQCIDSTFVSSIGKFVDEFENNLKSYTGAGGASLCVNGTNALHISLLLAGVQPNDEVITQSLSFIATSNAILYANASPIYLDVDEESFGLCPFQLEKFLIEKTYTVDGQTYNSFTKRRISAILPVHVFGTPCKIEAIIGIANKYNLKVIEDAAEGLGASIADKHVGTFGDFGVISFNGNKIITAGGGGVILTKRGSDALQAKNLTSQLKIAHKWKFDHQGLGYNYRMPNINAALGLAQLEKIKEKLKYKKETFLYYQEHFNNIKGLKLINPIYHDNIKPNFWLNTLKFSTEIERDNFLEESMKAKIFCRPPWSLLHEQPHLKRFQTENMSNSILISKTTVNIPSSSTI